MLVIVHTAKLGGKPSMPPSGATPSVAKAHQQAVEAGDAAPSSNRVGLPAVAVKHEKVGGDGGGASKGKGKRAGKNPVVLQVSQGRSGSTLTVRNTPENP